MQNAHTLDLRRLLFVGAVALTVGIPTLACSGGSGGGDEAEEVAEVEEDDAGTDAAAKIQGTWQVQPEASQLRELKIVNLAINKPNAKVEQLNKKLDPDATPEEVAMFNELKKADPSSPEVAFAKTFIQMMKDARLEVDANKWTLTMAGDTDSWTYTVASSSDDSVTVKLESGETNEMTFVNDDLVKVKIVEGGESMDVQFRRM